MLNLVVEKPIEQDAVSLAAIDICMSRPVGALTNMQ